LEESPAPRYGLLASKADSRDGPDDGLEEYRGFTTHVGGYTTSIFSTNAPEEALQPMRGGRSPYEQKLTRGEEMQSGQ